MVYKVRENELSVTNTSNMGGKLGTRFWNKYVNGSDLNIEKNGNSDEDKNK